ncbi:MAG: TIGR01906 family membrane protein [Clostridiales bacterium]|nr:TIGR01906 family membrane protein [Clostridiales bacterium]
MEQNGKELRVENRKPGAAFAAGVFAAICIALLCISLAIVLTVNFRPLYYHDMTVLDIPGQAGMSTAEVRLNYDALIDYNEPFFTGPLEFPTLPMSDHGRIHFAQVKQIFVACYILAAACAVLLFFLIRFLRRRTRGRYLIWGGVLAVAIPAAVLALLAAVGWDQAFVILHGILFNNNYWIFDPQTDPVILMLPDTFFLHCLIMIIILIVVFAAVFITAGVRKGRKERDENE